MFSNVSRSLSKIKVAFILFAVAIIAVCGCACSGNVAKIEKSGYPNKATENAKISDKYNTVSNEIANDAVEEYMKLIKIPHPSQYEDALRAYLVN